MKSNLRSAYRRKVILTKTKRLKRYERDNAAQSFRRGVTQRVNSLLELIQPRLSIAIDVGRPLRLDAGGATFWHMSFQLFLRGRRLGMGQLSPVLNEVLDYPNWIKSHAFGVLEQALKLYRMRETQLLNQMEAQLRELQKNLGCLAGIVDDDG